MTFEITSPVFADKTKMPALYTCEGKNISPPLQWTGAPGRNQKSRTDQRRSGRSRSGSAENDLGSLGFV